MATTATNRPAIRVLLTWILLCVVDQATAATYQRWLPPAEGSGEQDDRFGSAIASNGEWIFVAADYDRVAADGYRTDSAVHVYKRVGASVQWVQRLRRPNSGEYEYPNLRFGKAMAAAEGLVAIGAPGDRSGRGAVYLYALKDDRWVLTQMLISAGDSIRSFGYLVAFDGTTVIASSYSNTSDIDVFERSGPSWLYRQRISPDGGGIPNTLDVDGDVMAIGIAGKVAVWRRAGAGTWAFEQALLGEAQVGFPSSVDVEAGKILVGDPNVTTFVGSGAAQVFLHDSVGWVRAARLELPTGAFEGTMKVGAAVAWRGGNAYVSIAPQSGPLQPQRDGVAQFVQSGIGWNYQSSTIDSVDDLQYAGTIMTPLADGGVAMAMPQRATDAGGNAGRAYVFDGSQQLIANIDLGVGAFRASRALIEENFVVVPYSARPGLRPVFDVLERAQNGWAHRRRITLPTALAAPVSLCGGFAVAVAPQGALLIDVTVGNAEPITVMPPVASSGPIQCSGNNLVFGNPSSSRVYAFRRIGASWSLAQTIDNPDPSFPTFGSSLSVDKDRMLVTKWSQVYAYAWSGTSWEPEGSFSCSDCGVGDRVIVRDGDRIAFSNCSGCLNTVRRIGSSWIYEASSSQQFLADSGLRDGRIIATYTATRELVPSSGGGLDILRSFVDQDGTAVTTSLVAIQGQEAVFTVTGVTDPRTDNPDATVILFEHPDELFASSFE